MLRKSVAIIFLTAFITSCSSSSKLSSSTKLLLNEYHKAKQKAEQNENKISLPEKIVNDYALNVTDNNYLAKAFAKVNDALNEKELLKLGATVNSKIDGTWTITIPLDKIEELAKLNGIEFIDINIKSNIR